MTVRRRYVRAAVHALAIATLIAAGARVSAAQEVATAATTQAWTASLAAESTGDVRHARAIMVTAFGEHPDTYAPCVRLAWLSLQLNRGREAAELYRRARQLPGALLEATQGLTLALARAGYEELDRGNIPSARRHWQEALRLDASQADALAGLDLVGPSASLTPEVWGGHVTSTSNASSANVLYVQVPARINDHVSVRGVFRSALSPGAARGTTSAFESQQEFFGGATVEQGVAAVEVIGLRLHASSGDTTGGVASLRVGGRAGVTLTASGLNNATGWNTQFMPEAFVWVSPTLALAGGLRVTTATSTTTVSGIAGATVNAGALRFDIAGHAGTERSALTVAGPTILSFANDTTAGGSVTAAYRVDRSTTVFAQLQFEQLSASAGRYMSLAGGIRFTLSQK